MTNMDATQASRPKLYTNCSGNAASNRESDASCQADGAAEWFAFRVRPRHEKKVVLHLEGREYLLPVSQQTRHWGKRKVQVELPLVPGYVFCRQSRLDLLPILKIPGVIDVLRVAQRPAAIPSAEMHSLGRALDSHLLLEPHRYLESGHTVTIQSGPLAGVTGIVVDRRGGRQLVLSITLLRRSVLVHVEEDALQLSSEPFSAPLPLPHKRAASIPHRDRVA